MRTTTVITGCSLVDGGACVWGDLWEQGDTWILNAVLHNGQTAWAYGNLPPDFIKQVKFKGTSGFFERRGVIVIAKEDCELNQAATNYLMGAKS